MDLTPFKRQGLYEGCFLTDGPQVLPLGTEPEGRAKGKVWGMHRGPQNGRVGGGRMNKHYAERTWQSSQPDETSEVLAADSAASVNALQTEQDGFAGESFLETRSDPDGEWEGIRSANESAQEVGPAGPRRGCRVLTYSAIWVEQSTQCKTQLPIRQTRCTSRIASCGAYCCRPVQVATRSRQVICKDGSRHLTEVFSFDINRIFRYFEFLIIREIFNHRHSPLWPVISANYSQSKIGR